MAGADLSLGGAALAAEAINTGFVDEYQLNLVPAVVDGGKGFPARNYDASDSRASLFLDAGLLCGRPASIAFGGCFTQNARGSR